MTRDERQELCLQNWRKSGGRSSLVCTTGFGKTRIALNAIEKSQIRNPGINILVVVPTTTLQDQWNDELSKRIDNTTNINVVIINTIIKHKTSCDLLILDEVHRYPAETFSQVFECVNYKWIMCLTATFERLDGKHELIAKYAPVVDVVTTEECEKNNWIAHYKEFTVVLTLPDKEKYDQLSRNFQEHFEVFDSNFPLLMSMLGENGWEHRNDYADRTGMTARDVMIHAMGAARAMNERKKFLSDHLEKLRVAEEIIALRPNKKIITFSNTVAMAEMFSTGVVYTGKNSKKKNRITIEEFKEIKEGVINTSRLADTGLDVPDLDVGIRLGLDSSKTRHVQSRGRVTRSYMNKNAEFFTLIFKDTKEVEWWRNSVNTGNLIDEQNLLLYLKGEPYELYKEQLKRYYSRY